MTEEEKQHRISQALDSFKIELPSWGFSNTGTRFGKFQQPGAAATVEEKFADAAEVHALTGVTPTLALHVEWDLPRGQADVARIHELEARYGLRAGAINPNLFQAQEYKYGSICNPDPEIRRKALDHLLASVEIAKQLNSRDVVVWLADGSNYPGSQSIRRRIGWLREIFGQTYKALGPGQRLLLEYKPFEPAFYHTDLADWGMSYEMAREAGPNAFVLVDTGHHYQGQNIEQIVAWLLDLRRLGGFHFNDRRYADDDLTLGSIDPYQVFRIFHEILSYQEETGRPADVPFMIDQSHNLKGKIEAAVQTVVTAMEIFAKAALVDRFALSQMQEHCDVVEAEECFRSAFWDDVRPMVREWRHLHGLPEDPLRALKESRYVEKIAGERGERNLAAATASYA